MRCFLCTPGTKLAVLLRLLMIYHLYLCILREEIVIIIRVPVTLDSQSDDFCSLFQPGEQTSFTARPAKSR